MMNIVIFILGSFVLHVASSEETVRVSVSVSPPGLNIFLGDSLLLRCTVESNSSFVWSYSWFRHNPHTALSPNPRHLVYGESYSITAVTKEDAGRYMCEAKGRERNISSVVLLSQPANLKVSDQPPAFLAVTPSSRQFFRGERITLQCPGSLSSSSSWTLRRFPPAVRSTVNYTDHCSPLEEAVGAERPHTCVFTAARETSALYWCESSQGRSSAVNITVSQGSMVLRTPALPVLEGETVDLYCLCRTAPNGKTIFFKNGEEVVTSSSSSSDRTIKMTIENVTKEDEGFYKCASEDQRMESPESWLSVRQGRGNLTSEGTDASRGPWMWILLSCSFVLLLCGIVLSFWLVRHFRHQTFYMQTCWPFSKEELSAVGIPATKQDVTEVQWDLSWMEMSNLLDKQLESHEI